ncbi:hypothetical protein GALL_206310 [mine drainage metagenome]|uniref:Uncharacterized protein n=1 Tax=mine drainage metagenome TaxID=410659 RepID=A0A1J5S6F7_9ZZZZ
MGRTLIQQGTFKTLNFTIDDTGLQFHKKRRESNIELHFAFEQIKTNKASEIDHNKFLLVCANIAAFFFLLFFIMSFSDRTIEGSTIIFWLVTSLAIFIIYFFSRSKKIYLYTTENKLIEFYADKPNENEVNEFIEELLNERTTYLVSKYGNPNRNLEYAPQLDNLNWLLNVKAITKSTYDEKIRELNSLFNNISNSPIGFVKQN